MDVDFLELIWFPLRHILKKKIINMKNEMEFICNEYMLIHCRHDRRAKKNVGLLWFISTFFRIRIFKWAINNWWMHEAIDKNDNRQRREKVKRTTQPPTPLTYSSLTLWSAPNGKRLVKSILMHLSHKENICVLCKHTQTVNMV